MSDEMTAVGTGAASGAASGAMIGSVFPGPGTAIGAGVGAVVGGAAGYLSSRGNNKRKRAMEEARNRYMQAIAAHNENLRRIGVAQQANIAALSQQAQGNMDVRFRGMPGDQTESAAHDYGNQMSALQAAPLPEGSALQGPLADTYNQEMANRTQTALSPMARGYAYDQQGQAMLANERDYANRQAALQPNASYQDMSLGLFGAQSDAALSRAENAYGIDRQRAGQAGSEQMLYGALLQQGLNTGASLAGSYKMGHRAHGVAPAATQSALAPSPVGALPSRASIIANTPNALGLSPMDALNGYYSRVPNQNAYRMG